MNSICAVIALWLNASQRSQVGVGMNRSVMGVKCKALRSARQSGYRAIMRTYVHLKLLHTAVKTSVLELVFSKVMVSLVSQLPF